MYVIGEKGQNYYDAVYRNKVVANMVRKAKELGYCLVKSGIAN